MKKIDASLRRNWPEEFHLKAESVAVGKNVLLQAR